MLVQFKDGCGICNGQNIDRGFYEYKAFFLAAKGIAEFNYSQQETIVDKIIDYVLNGCLVWTEANDALMTTKRKVAITILTKRLEEAIKSFDEDAVCKIAEVLGQISPGDERALKALSHLILNSSTAHTRRKAINVFWKIAASNAVTIEILLDMIRNSSDDYICHQAVRILGKLSKDNNLAIEALVQRFGNYFDRFNLDVYKLAKIVLHDAEKHNYLWYFKLINFIKNPSDKNTQGLYFVYLLENNSNILNIKPQPEIADLIEIIENNTNSRDSSYGLAILDIGRYGKGDKRAIATLTKLCQGSSDEFTKLSAVESLYQIAPLSSYKRLIIKILMGLVKEVCHPYIVINAIELLCEINEIDDEFINTLEEVIKTADNESIAYQAAEALGTKVPGNEIAIGKFINLIETYRCEYEKIGKSIDLIDIFQDYERNILYLAGFLARIAPEKEILHDVLIQLTKNSSDESVRYEASNTLIEITNEYLAKKIVANFKGYLLPRKYENSLKLRSDVKYQMILNPLSNNSLRDKHRNNCWHFEQYYELMWICSERLNYAEFHELWHQNNFIFYLKWIWQEILFRLGFYKGK